MKGVERPGKGSRRCSTLFYRRQPFCLSTFDSKRARMTLTLNPAKLTKRSYGRDIEDLIGNTPLLSFEHITAHLPQYVSVYAKAEWTNPGGSVKDRAALGIIRQAEKSGALRPGKVILDSTSGNTGIAYAMLGAAKGYRVKLFVPANASPSSDITAI